MELDVEKQLRKKHIISLDNFHGECCYSPREGIFRRKAILVERLNFGSLSIRSLKTSRCQLAVGNIKSAASERGLAKDTIGTYHWIERVVSLFRIMIKVLRRMF